MKTELTYHTLQIPDRAITVKELKEYLSIVPDDAIIFRCDNDKNIGSLKKVHMVDYANSECQTVNGIKPESPLPPMITIW